jgi:hypothetical protein
MLRAYGIDVQVAKAVEEKSLDNYEVYLQQSMQKVIKDPVKSGMLTPKEWAERVQVVQLWNQEDKRSQNEFRKQHPAGYKWLGDQGYKVEVHGDGATLLLRSMKTRGNDGVPTVEHRQLVHIFSTFDIIEESHMHVGRLKAQAVHSHIKLKIANISIREVECFLELFAPAVPWISLAKSKLRVQSSPFCPLTFGIAFR